MDIGCKHADGIVLGNIPGRIPGKEHITRNMLGLVYHDQAQLVALTQTVATDERRDRCCRRCSGLLWIPAFGEHLTVKLIGRHGNHPALVTNRE